ncbi:flagellar motor protein MotB [Sphingomonas endolithica]|uniref:flagellar motor protein MotB n=1 Tax=Sphingomonas endolithica TaxID=2972485 RepID=UPI0021B05C9B|nr:flagellar motor protein MotB [Sphingomonas sp. ZFBP2030]
MTPDDFPEDMPARPAWLMTLADLALLLVGFFVFVQAITLDRQALAQGIRAGFGVRAAIEPAMPVAAAAMLNFAPGSATLPSPSAGLVAWAREATRDPRVTLTITGGANRSARDVDPGTTSGTILAIDRARAVAAALARAGAIPAERMTIASGGKGRSVIVTLGFAGGRQ